MKDDNRRMASSRMKLQVRCKMTINSFCKIDKKAKYKKQFQP
jgi:hypothetical protein